MKRILGIITVAGLLTAAPAAFAGVDVFFDFGVPAPVYAAPLPPVAYYRHGDPRWFERREYFEHNRFHERHDFRHYYR